jgi:predicted DNA-binding protein (MmcQ/YjbR family)
MDATALRSLCLGFPGAVETYPFGPENTVFKVEKKIFALTRLDAQPVRVSLKCEPELAVQLRADHAAIVPGYHLNKRHWNTVTLDGSVPEQLVRDMVEDSYDLIVSRLPRLTQVRLGWSATLDP